MVVWADEKLKQYEYRDDEGGDANALKDGGEGLLLVKEFGVLALELDDKGDWGLELKVNVGAGISRFL